MSVITKALSLTLLEEEEEDDYHTTSDGRVVVRRRRRKRREKTTTNDDDDDDLVSVVSCLDIGEQRRLLGDILIRSDVLWSHHVLNAIDEVYRQEYCQEIQKQQQHQDVIDVFVNVDDIPIMTTYPKTTTETTSSTSTTTATKISLYRGDITKLKGNNKITTTSDSSGRNVVAIVNAANDSGCGCYQPQHKCIDNIIHRSAGPRLRMECREKMKSRRRRYPSSLLSVGTKPIITSAYHLPCDKIIHITGPQVVVGSNSRSLLSNIHREQLYVTYRNVLDAVVEYNNNQNNHDMNTSDSTTTTTATTKNNDNNDNDDDGNDDATTTKEKNTIINTIVFCCISTGLFGFPQDIACQIAITTVKEWLLEQQQKQQQHQQEQKIEEVEEGGTIIIGDDDKMKKKNNNGGGGGVGHHYYSSSIQHIIFDVFTTHDEELYKHYIQQIFDY